MASCAQCGVDILFGGVRADSLRFCGHRCHDVYTEWKGALQSYQDLLRQLRQSPTDPQLKQKTLEAGRNYSAWTRRGKGVTVFDELALSNDIAAACAAAASIVPAAPTLTLEQRLERLQGLKQKGLISDQEYNAKRSQILAEL